MIGCTLVKRPVAFLAADGDTEKSVAIHIVGIIASFKLYVAINESAYTKSDSKTSDVNGREEAVPKESSPGDSEIVSEHGACIHPINFKSCSRAGNSQNN